MKYLPITIELGSTRLLTVQVQLPRLVRLDVRHDAGEISPHPETLAPSSRHDLAVED